MDDKVLNHLKTLISRYPELAVCESQIAEAYSILENVYASKGKLLVAGNGGSAADSEHVVGELMKGFIKPRPLSAELQKALTDVDPEAGAALAQNLQGSLTAIALDGHPGLTTAVMNDCDQAYCFAQQLCGFGVAGDAFLAISTSGNSKNIIYAATVAKAKGIKIVGLTGEKESKLSQLADVCIRVPETVTFKIQELHLPVYHCLCLMLEEHFF